MVPKSLCDVRNVEVNRVLKLADNSVLPISFILPRADNLKSFFQDDIYVPTRGKDSYVSVDEWMCEQGTDLVVPNLHSMQPEGMPLLSDKPEEEVKKSKASVFREELNKADDEKKKQEESFLRLQNLAIQRSKYHPNPSGGSGGHGFKVDAAPVHDDDSDNDWDS
jgi:coronin-7